MKENYPLLVSEIKKMLGTFPANEELLALLERMDQPAPDNEGEAPPVRLRRQLRDSEARYQRIIECTTDLIYECDAQGYFTYANPVACSTFGYSLEEMQKMHFLDAAAPEHRDMVRRFYKQQFDERIPDTYLEFMNLTRDGRNVWVGHNVHLQQDNNRDWVLGFHGVARDITKAKATEQALIDARRTAEDSAKAKEHFLSVMSHEMRTPLNAVIGLSHLLLEENPLANQVEHLQAIKHSADSLMMIINEVLDFSKIESGKVIFENTTFSLDELLKGVEQSLGYKARNAGLELLVQLDPNLPAKITGDPLRLTQILLNLAGNAVKFTEKGCVQIGVQQISRNTETITIEFKVSDTGIGIPKDKLETVFDSFTQASHETSRKYGGTGLGLAITKQLVERQGGLIHVQSKMGRGSTFTVLLTFGLNSALESAASPPAAQPIPSLALRGAHILLVEDNRMNQLVVKKFLEKWGMRLQIAENGIEAIEKLRSAEFDLVLMDLQMPQMDGYKTARHIRQNLDAPARKIPIVALTASATTDVRRKTVEAGMNDFVAKPFDPRDLHLKILKFTNAPAWNDMPTNAPEETAASGGGYVNLQYLEEISANNQEFITDMLRLFLRQMPQFVEKLKKSCETAHWNDMRYVLHKMKASLATIGIFELESVVRQLETYAAQESNLAEVAQLAGHLERVCTDVYAELRDKMAEKKASSELKIQS